MSDASPIVGETYLLKEPDYRFGTGPLLVRVARVIAPVEFDTEVWWQVEALCRPPGADMPGQPRELYIRADRLAAALRS